MITDLGKIEPMVRVIGRRFDEQEGQRFTWKAASLEDCDKALALGLKDAPNNLFQALYWKGTGSIRDLVIEVVKS